MGPTIWYRHPIFSKDMLFYPRYGLVLNASLHINMYTMKNAGYTQLVERTGSILQENEILDVGRWI